MLREIYFGYSILLYTFFFIAHFLDIEAYKDGWMYVLTKQIETAPLFVCNHSSKMKCATVYLLTFPSDLGTEV